MLTTEKSIVFGDSHIPFEDKRAVELTLKFIKSFKPDRIFINGDLLDCWEISDFPKPLDIDVRLRDEIDQTVAFLTKLRKLSPDSDITFIFGNHEFRFERYIAAKGRELKGLISLEKLLQLKEFNIKVINSHQRENYYQYGKLLIGHFNQVRKHSGYTAKGLLEDKGMSLIQNHTHRGGASYKRDYASTKVAFENFCLCDLNPPYCQIPNWQLGFSTIHKSKRSDFFKVTPVEIIKYRILYGDRFYSL